MKHIKQQEINELLASKLQNPQYSTQYFCKKLLEEDNIIYQRRSFRDIKKFLKLSFEDINDEHIMIALIENKLRCYYCDATQLIVFFNWGNMEIFKCFHDKERYEKAFKSCKKDEISFLEKLYDKIYNNY